MSLTIQWRERKEWKDRVLTYQLSKSLKYYRALFGESNRLSNRKFLIRVVHYEKEYFNLTLVD